jgi:hypothetical protein
MCCNSVFGSRLGQSSFIGRIGEHDTNNTFFPPADFGYYLINLARHFKCHSAIHSVIHRGAASHSCTVLHQKTKEKLTQFYLRHLSGETAVYEIALCWLFQKSREFHVTIQTQSAIQEETIITDTEIRALGSRSSQEQEREEDAANSPYIQSLCGLR